MAKKLVTDELWEVIEPLLPEEPPKPNGGRPRVDDRATLTGILFVLKSGIPWEMLPQQMGCGSGMTCWRRLKEWHEAGVWEELHRVLLDRLGKAEEIDWERASLDSASVPAPGGGNRPARIRQIRERRAPSALRCGRPRRPPPLDDPHFCKRPRLQGPRGDCRRHLTDPQASPWSAEETPQEAAADKGYDFPRCREALRKRGITPRIARRGIDSSEKLGRYRWAVERTLLDQPLPAAESALRASRRHPSGVPGSRMRSHLLALCTAVMLGALMRTRARSGPSDMSTVGPPYSPKAPRRSGELSLSPKRTPTGGSTSTSSTEGIGCSFRKPLIGSASLIVLASLRWVTRRPREDGGRAAHTRYLKSWLDTLPESGSPPRSCAVPATKRERISGGKMRRRPDSARPHRW